MEHEPKEGVQNPDHAEDPTRDTAECYGAASGEGSVPVDIAEEAPVPRQPKAVALPAEAGLPPIRQPKYTAHRVNVPRRQNDSLVKQLNEAREHRLGRWSRDEEAPSQD